MVKVKFAPESNKPCIRARIRKNNSIYELLQARNRRNGVAPLPPVRRPIYDLTGAEQFDLGFRLALQCNRQFDSPQATKRSGECPMAPTRPTINGPAVNGPKLFF